jgi:hypothetical protein
LFRVFKGKLALVHFHGAFISFMALYFVHGALFPSWHFILFMALLFFLHSACCSCIALYSNSKYEPALIYFSLQIIMQLLFQFLDMKRLIS